MVRAERLELPTVRVEAGCSDPLSYARACLIVANLGEPMAHLGEPLRPARPLGRAGAAQST